jgi:hypothetical protein
MGFGRLSATGEKTSRNHAARRLVQHEIARGLMRCSEENFVVN